MKRQKNIVLLFFLLLALTPILVSAQQGTELERKLAEDIQDYHLDDFSLIEAAFILSGANQPESLHVYMDWYDELMRNLRSYHFDRFDRIGSAAKVFSYLHSNWLITYKEKATTLINVVHQKRYNCVAGTILYNLVCEDLGWATEAFETPTHTYTIFPNFTEQVMVENTTPMGFNIMKNLHEYSKYLLQFYPQRRALQIGLDRIYAYENSKGRRIDNTELLGLLAYNRAYFAMKDKDYPRAYDFVLLAQSFNKDSRSNVSFEIDLYYKWGQKLFNEKKYRQAFEVYADAAYRYWDNKDFIHNCKASFFNAIRENWQRKDWACSQKLTAEILELQILKPEEITRLQKILQNWANYFYKLRDKSGSEQVILYLDQINPDDPELKAFKKAVEQIR